jgi:hypothetical protein
MIIGSMGYEVHSGLGHLLRDFYQHGIVNRVFPIKHSHYQNYPGQWIAGRDRYDNPNRFVEGLEVLLLFENAFNWSAVKRAKRNGTKVVMIPNYEYTPFPLPVVPDLMLCGSSLDVDYYKDLYKTEMLTIPVDTDRFPWRERTTARTFIHNAGHGQRGFAKGTLQVVDAMQYVQSPVTLIVRGQPGEKRIRDLFGSCKGNQRIDLRYGEYDESELYADGDVFINAEQYNGMSLPLQEAYASGMVVMTTDRYPTNTWLPPEPLLPVSHYEPDKICVEFDRAVVDPRAIADSIDSWYGRDVSGLSAAGRKWAAEHSWSAMKPKYLDVLSNL